jgi:hypothetical protein
MDKSHDEGENKRVVHASSTRQSTARNLKAMRVGARVIPFLIVVLWMLWIAVTLVANQSHSVGAGDFSYYYRGAMRILNEQGLYTNLNVAYDYVGPPLVVQMVIPLAAFSDFKGAAALWFLVNLIALAASLAMMSSIFSDAAKTRRTYWVFWLLPLGFMPLFYAFWLGQVTPIMLFFTVGAWYAYRKGYPVLTGLLLAIVVWTKFYPGLLILYFVWKREWRVVGSAIIGTGLVILFQMTLVGVDGFIAFFRDVLPPLLAEGQIAVNHSNNSVLGFAQRLFTPSPQVIYVADSPLLTAITRYGLTAALLSSLLVLSVRTPLKATSQTVFDVEYSLTLLVAMLLGSTLGYHSLIAAILPMVVVYQAAGKAVVNKRRAILYTMVAYLLMNIHLFIMLGALKPPSDNMLPALALSLPFFGMMLLWALLVRAHMQVSPIRHHADENLVSSVGQRSSGST